MDKEKRLARLEEEAANQRWPVPVARSRPSAHELDEELERVDLVHERCFESGLEDFQVMSDMIAYFEVGGVLSGSHHPLWDRGGGGGAS
jgi:hypothetical protein